MQYSFSHQYTQYTEHESHAIITD